MFTYLIHGLNILSPFALLPQTQEPGRTIDITVFSLAKRPPLRPIQDSHVLKNSDGVDQARIQNHEDGSLSFEFFSVGFFLFKNKTLYVVQENNDADFFLAVLTTQTLPLLSSLHRLTLHGGVISQKKNAVAFLAPEGSGKSTLTGFLKTRGYEMLSDDVAAVEPFKQGAIVHCGLPEIRLHKDSFLKIFAQIPSEQKLAKFMMPTEPPHLSIAQLRAIYCLAPYQQNESGAENGAKSVATSAGTSTVERLSSSEGFSELLKNQFLWNLWSKKELQKNFSALSHLCRYIPIYKLRYPLRYDGLPWLEQQFLKALDVSEKNLHLL